MTFNTPYSVLGILSPTQTWKDVTQTHIRSAYRHACMDYHPDRPQNKDNPDYDPDSFLLIQAAYDLLIDPASRQAYDAHPYPFPRADIEDSHSLMTQKDAYIENEARELITSIFNRHVESLSASSARRFDFQFTIRREIKAGMQQMKSASRETALKAKKLNIIRHRLSPTPYLHLVLRNKRQSNVRQYLSARQQIDIGHRALAILTEVDYKQDPAEPMVPKTPTGGGFKFDNMSTSFIPGGIKL